MNRRPARFPLQRGAIAALILTAGTLACGDGPTEPEISPREGTDANPPSASTFDLDPMVGILIGSLEDAEAARFAHLWVDSVSFALPPNAPLQALQEIGTTWTVESDDAADLPTLHALRLLLGDVPGGPENQSPKGVVR